MRKKSLFILIGIGFIAGAIILLGSCLPPDAGGKLLVDEDGHFIEDIVYNEVYSLGGGVQGKQITTFSKNGSYEMVQRAHEGEGVDYDGDGEVEEGWVNDDGQKGSYSWDPNTNTLTKTITKEIVEGEWESLDDKISTSEPILFTEYKYFYVYTESSRTESGDSIFKYKETRESDSGSYILEAELRVYPEAKKISSSLGEETKDDNGDISYGFEYEGEGNYEIFPAGRVFSLGNTGSLSGEVDSQMRNYDTINQEWGDWSESVTAFNMDFSHTGEYLLVDAIMSGDLDTISSSFRNLDN
jgi:hypothetical protein